ncbi:CHAD domain-containing protein [Methyloceanibacter caenitepidi]|nr:CHAD domain-containing protein [Methyloceanibacter caenitepidi]
MSYQLDPALPISEALRSVALDQLDVAHTSLASTPDRHKGVHSARKCFKRLRSLLVLARPGLPEPLYANLNARVARIGKGLAAARDAHALFDALNTLERNTEPGLGDGPIEAMRGWLRERRKAAEQNLEQNSASQSLEMLLELRPRFASLVVYPDNFTPISKGLQLSYYRAREQFKSAFRSKDSELIHDWRKSVQRHWRHMQLLTPCWPSELGARTEAARGLSQTLGDDHDIANLMHLATTPAMAFGSPEDISGFLKRCKIRLKELRKDAKIRGERLFVEKSAPFAGRIHAYWTTAAVGALKPVEPARQDDNVIAIGHGRPDVENQKKYGGQS